MKRLLCSLLLLISNSCFASGFGWYVTLIPWGDFQEEITAAKQEAIDVSNSAPGNQKVREYLQRKLDHVIWQHCASQHPMYRQLSPRYLEFYSVRTLQYAQTLQINRGKKNSLFDLFFTGKPYVRIIPSWSWSKTDPALVVEPDEVIKWHAELRELNASVRHAEEHAHLLEHLEAVLQLANADRYPGKQGAEHGMRTGLLFCGHD